MLAALLPMLKGLLNPRVLAGIAVAIALAWGYFHVKHVGYVQAQAELQPKIDGLQATLDAERLQSIALAEKAKAEKAETERKWEARLQEAQNEYATAQKETAKALAKALAKASAHVADAQQLRGVIAAYASNGGSAADDTVAAARGRAEALGVLLAEALALDAETLRASAESAEAAESAGNAVRALMAAWPR